jgi:hypothetical protein
MSTTTFLVVAAGGFVGAPCRYLLDRAVTVRVNSDLPWGTFSGRHQWITPPRTAHRSDAQPSSLRPGKGPLGHGVLRRLHHVFDLHLRDDASGGRRALPRSGRQRRRQRRRGIGGGDGRTGPRPVALKVPGRQPPSTPTTASTRRKSIRPSRRSVARSRCAASPRSRRFRASRHACRLHQSVHPLLRLRGELLCSRVPSELGLRCRFPVDPQDVVS